MSLRSLPKSEWKPFFDRMSHALFGKRAEIEVASLDLGDQLVTESVPMLGITYESKDNLLDVALDGLSHLIRDPRDIVVEETANGIRSVAVVDGDGARQTVILKEPLMLPAASHAKG